MLAVLFGSLALFGGFISAAVAGDPLGVTTTETVPETVPQPAPQPLPDPDPAPPPPPAAPAPPAAPTSSPPPSEPASPAASRAVKKEKEPVTKKRRKAPQPPLRTPRPLRAMPASAVSGGMVPWARLPVVAPEIAADSGSPVSGRVLGFGLLAFACAVFLILALGLPAVARPPVSDDTRLQLGILAIALPIVLALGFLIAG